MSLVQFWSPVGLRITSFWSNTAYPVNLCAPVSLCCQWAACAPSHTALSTKRPTNATSWVSAQTFLSRPTSAPQVQNDPLISKLPAGHFGMNVWHLLCLSCRVFSAGGCHVEGFSCRRRWNLCTLSVHHQQRQHTADRQRWGYMP